MNNVRWQNAVKYCNLVSELQGFTSCYSVNGSTDIHDWGDFDPDEVVCNFKANGWRLPTVEEWQYAARGGKNNDKYKYSGSNNLDEVAWHHDNSKDSDFRWRTHEVATKKPNSLGLYDMTGNVWEWCWEKYQGTHVSDKVVMGGGYYSSKNDCEISHVDFATTSYGEDHIGFRMVRNAEELPEEETVATSKAEPESQSKTEPAPESKVEPEITQSSETAEAEPAVSSETESKSKAKEKKAKKCYTRISSLVCN